MKYFMITGTSRGLGEALAYQLIQKNHHVICIARNENASLIETARQRACLLDSFSSDLGDSRNIDALMEAVFAKIDLQSAEGLYLINNAGVLDPIKPVGRSESGSVIRNIQVNLLAPMLLIESFIRLSLEYDIDKRIINVSSGAGRKPYEGWSSYCSAKAGVDMFTRCVALEAEKQNHPVRIVSFGPGVMDTDMQAGIRKTGESDFVQLQKFLDLKKDGKLLPASQVAEVLIRLIFSEAFPQGEYIDVYTLMNAGK